MTSLLFLGFLIGMRHALDADHLAAVAAISTQQNSFRSTIRHGAVWGLGHTITLFLFGSTVIWMDSMMPEQMATYLEMAVGIMLMVLGLDVMRRVIQQRIHYHVHKHHHANAHFHAHSHAGETKKHEQSDHHHRHENRRFPYRTLFIGLMHGMAGSAALILLTMQTMDSLWTGMLYMLLFGTGSMVGMAVISAAIAIPLQASARGLTWMHNGLQFSSGILTLGLGLSIVV